TSSQTVWRPASAASDTVDGNAPLHEAAAAGKQDAVMRLIQAGAAVSQKNAHGKTPAELAREAGFAELGGMLDKTASPS
ncbi:MAG TPA: hypothetical protein P5141_10910, partial [Candidatus Hydrogenedentes bacterium]|nr:hypothetical protein [Candidatus Hydrogenedentota bacterium]